MKFGVFLPSFLQRDATHDHPARLRAFARHAEELGFDSLWITDHVVTARRFYSVSWLDSLMTLAHVAAVTERVRLGTSILILPLRQPAVLAKELATLHHLSEGRYVYGIGTGWYGPEFEACGVHKAERGAHRRGARSHARALSRPRRLLPRPLLRARRSHRRTAPRPATAGVGRGRQPARARGVAGAADLAPQRAPAHRDIRRLDRQADLPAPPHRLGPEAHRRRTHRRPPVHRRPRELHLDRERGTADRSPPSSSSASRRW